MEIVDVGLVSERFIPDRALALRPHDDERGDAPLLGRVEVAEQRSQRVEAVVAAIERDEEMHARLVPRVERPVLRR